MAIAYDPQTPLGRVRLYINDIESDKGPKPGRANFEDNEILMVLNDSGGDINRTVITFLDILANAWSAHAMAESDETKSYDARDTAQQFAARAKALRDSPIDAPTTSGSVALRRVDHWTIDNTSEY